MDGRRKTISIKKLTVMTIFLLGFLTLSVSETHALLRPNVVVIMTDDQTLESLRVMTKTLALIGGTEGTTFDNSFVSFSVCCPSRATFLTGQYSHNHGVKSNKPPAGGYAKLDHSNTLPVWLQEASYYTIHIGKYLNGYGVESPQTEIPAGWNDWQGLVDPSTYQMYGYTINDNGTLVPYGAAEEDYQTDVLADRAVAAINEQAGKSQPFFLSICPLAPHVESAGSPSPRSALRHQGTFASEPLPQPPSFNEADVSDKPAFIRNLPLLTATVQQKIITRYRARLESLLAVDDLVERVVVALQTTGQLANTVIFFTSDNGLFHGEHRIPGDKVKMYEDSVRVPLLVRGGGFPAGITAQQYVINVDLAPTIVELTGAAPRRVMDGQSLLPLALNANLGKDRALLLETSLSVNPTYQAVRTERYLYVEHSKGEKELYDMQNDPFQLVSRHTDMSYDPIKTQLQALVNQLRTCAGAGCSLSSGSLPTPTPTPSPPPTAICGGLTATIIGTAANDVLTGTAGPDIIHGLGGDDTISSLGGNDSICGGTGNDTLNGGDDSDRLFGENGNDALNGGNGNDTLNGGVGDDALDGGANTDTCNGGSHINGDTATNCETVTNVR